MSNEGLGMFTSRTELRAAETPAGDAQEMAYERWHEWPVNWSAVWVGALTAVALVLIFGLVGLALGAHQLAPDSRLVDVKKLGIGALIFSVFGAFLAFVGAGWATVKIAGILRADHAILHAAIAWIVALPIMILLIGLGAGGLMGGWYAGLGGSPAWASAARAPYELPIAPLAGATAEERTAYASSLEDYHAKVKQWNDDTPKVIRNSALGAITAVLLGLAGSTIGGWWASGESMSLKHHLGKRVSRTAHA